MCVCVLFKHCLCSQMLLSLQSSQSTPHIHIHHIIMRSLYYSSYNIMYEVNRVIIFHILHVMYSILTYNNNSGEMLICDVSIFLLKS